MDDVEADSSISLIMMQRFDLIEAGGHWSLCSELERSFMKSEPVKKNL